MPPRNPETGTRRAGPAVAVLTGLGIIATACGPEGTEAGLPTTTEAMTTTVDVPTVGFTETIPSSTSSTTPSLPAAVETTPSSASTTASTAAETSTSPPTSLDSTTEPTTGESGVLGATPPSETTTTSTPETAPEELSFIERVDIVLDRVGHRLLRGFDSGAVGDYESVPYGVGSECTHRLEHRGDITQADNRRHEGGFPGNIYVAQSGEMDGPYDPDAEICEVHVTYTDPEGNFTALTVTNLPGQTFTVERFVLDAEGNGVRTTDTNITDGIDPGQLLQEAEEVLAEVADQVNPRQ